MAYMKGTEMPESNGDWVEPQSIDEANERRAILIEDVGRMQAQLGGALTQEVKRMTRGQYRNWRGRVVFAVQAKQSELSRVNTWLSTNGNRNKGASKVRVLPSEDRSPLDTVRRLQAYTGKLFSLYIAVGKFLDEDTDESFDELVRTYELAHEVVPHRNEPAQFEDASPN